MQKAIRFVVLLLSMAVLSGCSVLGPETLLPRVDLQGFGAVGLVEFSSNATPSVNAQITREFGAQVHAAQPGTRIVSLGTQEALLAAVDRRELDTLALRRIGKKYGVGAIFVGNLNYSETKTDVQGSGEATPPAGAARTELRGDIRIELVETRTGASMWSTSAWAYRPLGRASVAASASDGGRAVSNPREAMVPALVRDLTDDFRPGTVRQTASR